MPILQPHPPVSLFFYFIHPSSPSLIDSGHPSTFVTCCMMYYVCIVKCVQICRYICAHVHIFICTAYIVIFVYVCIYIYTYALLLFSYQAVSNSFVTPWTVAHQAFMSMRFLRQEYQSGLPFPSPGDLLNLVIEPTSPVLAGRLFITEPPGKPIYKRVLLSSSSISWESGMVPTAWMTEDVFNLVLDLILFLSLLSQSRQPCNHISS